MSYGRDAYGEVAYGGGVGTAARGDVGLGAPAFTSAFSWSQSGGDEAYGLAAYGGRADINVPTAGLSVATDPAAGIITVAVFWAFAEFVTLVRVNEDTGVRTPVRDSPVRLDAGSRRNPQSNPKARDGLAGYGAGSNTTISQLTGLVIPGYDPVTTAARLTATAAGAVSVARQLDAAGTAVATYGFLVRTSAVASALGLSVTWYSASSASLGTVTYQASAKARTQAATDWSWATVTIDSIPFGAATGVVSVTASGMPAGGTVDVTAHISALGTADPGPYFDGDYPNAAWVGTPGLSYSDTGPVAYVTDAEVPFETPVHYELTAGIAPGFVAASTAVSLGVWDGRGKRQCLLTHPGLRMTFPVWIEDAPKRTRTIRRAEFEVRGRRNKVVVSAGRSGDTGTLMFVADSPEEFARLLSVFDDGSPLLLRLPPRLGYPREWWLSFGDLDLDPTQRSGLSKLRKISAPFTEVDRPSVATTPLVA